MGKNNKIKKLCTAGVIASLYAGLTYLSAALGLAYGPVQLRLSEALVILPIFEPVAVLGLVIGCFLGNLLSFNVLDLLFGTAATAIGAMGTYFFRKIRIKGYPLLSFLSPVIANTIIVPLEIYLFWTNNNTQSLIVIGAGILIGEIGAVIILGSFLYFGINKIKHKGNSFNEK